MKHKNLQKVHQISLKMFFVKPLKQIVTANWKMKNDWRVNKNFKILFIQINEYQPY